MQENVFSIARLWPDFHEILNGNISSSHGLSALIVAILIGLSLFFLYLAFTRYFQSQKQINFYKKLLIDVSQDELACKQRDLTQEALKNDNYGKLWKEFDETLVLSSDGERLYNTLDAAHFFNTSTLARGLTENRLLAAVPGFLTGIGVIGTFAGLQMGLGALELSESAGVDALRRGIGTMISGASIAFLTSVWGIFTSLLFNFIEKCLERGIRSKINSLQNHIDYLYPRINPEQSLVTIADLNRSSNETLQGLAEKIGDRLQEALVQTTDSIRTGLEDSLNQIMAPAIKSLVDGAQNGSQQALESLLDKFLEGVGEAGSSQKEMMQNASNDVRTAVSDLGNQMTSFLSSMNEQSRIADSEAQERQSLLEQQLKVLGEESHSKQVDLSNSFQEMFKGVVETLDEQLNASDQREQRRSHQLDEQMQVLADRNAEVVNTLGSNIATQLDNQQERDQERQTQFSNEVGTLKGVQQDLITKVEGLMVSHQQIFESMHHKFASLQTQFESLSEANRSAGNEVSFAAKEMQSVSNQLGMLSANVKQAADELGKNIGNAAETTVDLAEDNRVVSLEMQEALKGYQDLRHDLVGIVKDLNGATEHAENGFSAVHNHLESFQNALSKHVEDLEEKLQTLLVGYADRVESQTIDRLSVWNKHTSEYTSQMNNAVMAIANVVNEMETKCSAA